MMEQAEITPQDINTNNLFIGAFGHYETELIARAIVRYCQNRGGWFGFSESGLKEFYAVLNERVPFKLYYLASDEFLRHGEEGKLHVTEEFVRRCYTSSHDEVSNRAVKQLVAQVRELIEKNT